MKASLNWLKEYVNVPGPEELAEKLTLAGLEVEGIHRPGAALEGVVVAQIVESKPHPNADKLSVTQVDCGTQRLQVVCGAKNYQVGDKVPLATIGTTLPNGAAIQKSALRGVESFGMLCSAKELGLTQEAAGLLILDKKLDCGLPIAKALGIDDVVLEINVTPNRPDVLSHVGLAREISVLTGAPLNLPPTSLQEAEGAAEKAVKIHIEDVEGCWRYAGRVLEDIRPKASSPPWMVNRLTACGVRPLGLVVDVTNYVLLELGQPLHAFDLEKLAGQQVVIRSARAGERLTTLDGKERGLDVDDLVVCDRDRPQVLAGVMGGSQSEIGPETRRVLLESAYFQPSRVRRAAKRHGLHTESSHRFERGTDISMVAFALDRAAALLAEHGGAMVLKGRVDVFPKPLERRKVRLRHARLDALLGSPVPPADSQRILDALGFQKESEQASEVSYLVPFARVDVEREEDLIEEVARIRGYEHIPSILPKGSSELAPMTRTFQVESRIRAALEGLGFIEALNYSFISSELQRWTAPGGLEVLGQARPSIVLQNPLSVEQSVMRQSLYGGLLHTLSRNLRQQIETARIYEMGRVYFPDSRGGQEGRPVADEKLMVSGVLFGKREARTWAVADSAMDFFDAKAAVEAVWAALGIGGRFEPFEAVPYHPRASAQVLKEGVILGSMGELHPRVARALDLPSGIFLYELNMHALIEAAVLVERYEPLPKYPAVLRDLAVVVPSEVMSEKVRAAIFDVGAGLLEDVRVFDVYTGASIPAGHKSLAYGLRYRSVDRTLTDIEVNQAHTRIVEEVNARFGARLR